MLRHFGLLFSVQTVLAVVWKLSWFVVVFIFINRWILYFALVCPGSIMCCSVSVPLCATGFFLFLIYPVSNCIGGNILGCFYVVRSWLDCHHMVGMCVFMISSLVRYPGRSLCNRVRPADALLHYIDICSVGFSPICLFRWCLRCSDISDWFSPFRRFWLLAESYPGLLLSLFL